MKVPCPNCGCKNFRKDKDTFGLPISVCCKCSRIKTGVNGYKPKKEKEQVQE